MRARAVCVCRDASVCRVVGDALAVAGVDVTHTSEIPSDASDVALIVVDRESRRAAGDALREAAAPVVIVGDDLADDSLIALMLERPVSHLVRDPGDRELGITSEKLASGDLFGLEKYVSPGARIGARSVAGGGAARRLAIDEVTTWAESFGARRPLRHRIASVVDELLMNALYDAPREANAPRGEHAALLRWAHDDRIVAVSVSDPHGSLRQRDLIRNVLRARDDRGRPNPANGEDRGAGLGLYLVLANVASLIVNVAPGRQTEVVCLFDMARGAGRAITTGVRSLHVFQAG